MFFDLHWLLHWMPFNDPQKICRFCNIAFLLKTSIMADKQNLLKMQLLFCDDYGINNRIGEFCRKFVFRLLKCVFLFIFFYFYRQISFC